MPPLGNRQTGYSAVDLLATDFPEPKFAVPGVLAEGLNFIAGAPKLGKSWWALGIAIAVASGGRALGQIPVERGEVLYLSLEDSPRRIKDRLKKMLVGEPAPEGLHFYTEWDRLSDGGAEAITRWVEEHPAARLVIIDVLARVRAQMSDRGDRYLADYDAARPLKTVADKHGVAVAVLHHTRKAGAEDFVDLISGTNGLAGAADTILVVKRARGQADATLEITGRDIEEQNLALRFDGGIGTWTLLGDAAEWALSETRRKLLAALREQGALTPKALADYTDIAHETAKKTLQRMALDGQVKSTGDGSYRVPGVPLTPDSDLNRGDEGQRDGGDMLIADLPARNLPFSKPRLVCDVCGSITFFVSMDGRALCPRHKKEAS